MDRRSGAWIHSAPGRVLRHGPARQAPAQCGPGPEHRSQEGVASEHQSERPSGGPQPVVHRPAPVKVAGAEDDRRRRRVEAEELRRGSFVSVADLQQAIERFLDAWNAKPAQRQRQRHLWLRLRGPLPVRLGDRPAFPALDPDPGRQSPHGSTNPGELAQAPVLIAPPDSGHSPFGRIHACWFGRTVSPGPMP
jgi:hypothetical protein